MEFAVLEKLAVRARLTAERVRQFVEMELATEQKFVALVLLIAENVLHHLFVEMEVAIMEKLVARVLLIVEHAYRFVATQFATEAKLAEIVL